MFKHSTRLAVLLLTGMMPSSSAAEEYVLRVEEVVFEAVDLDFLERMNRPDGGGLDLSQGEVADSLEMHVKDGESFYGKTMGVKTSFEVHGSLKPHLASGQVAVNINVSQTTFRTLLSRENGRLFELPAETSLRTTVGVTIGKRLCLGGIASREGRIGEAPCIPTCDCRCIFITLRPARPDAGP